MANLVQWIEETAKGEAILGVVIGQMGWGDYNQHSKYDEQPKGTVLAWDVARPLLDYEFDNGYGAPGCNSIYVWTTNLVIAISQYDGATSPFSIPRNPQNVMPEMPGG